MSPSTICFQFHSNGPRIMFNKSHVTVTVLFIINLLNYMDRFTIAAVLTDVQSHFDINDAQVGLLQTVFVCAYMLFAPVCGYIGDRYSRKIIMTVGIAIWSTTVFISSLIPSDLFWLFFILRGIVGVGEASYSTIAPVIIADLFTNDLRTKMLMFFYFAIPVGSGLGYVCGAALSRAFGSWQWGIRLTPLLGIVCLFLLVFVIKEPVRGAAEKKTVVLEVSSWRKDVHYLYKNKTFALSSLGFVCIAFVSGAVSWWMPAFIEYSDAKRGVVPDKSRINLLFGVITCLAGFFGVSVGSMWARRWRVKDNRAICFVCASGLLVCTPFYFLVVNLIDHAPVLSWLLIFVAVTCLCLNWAILPDLLLHIVVPQRRATANAIQILFGHLLGDASSPYIVGYISTLFLGNDDSPVRHFYSLKYALLVPPFFLVLGGFFFLWCSMYVEHDRKMLETVLASSETNVEPNNDIFNNDDQEQAPLIDAGSIPT